MKIVNSRVSQNITRCVQMIKPVKLIPLSIRLFLKRFAIRVKYFGLSFFCPVCSSSARAFRTYGAKHRPNAKCPFCGALERYRMLWVFLKTRTDFFDCKSKKMLHIAPEKPLESKFKNIDNLNYLTGDLNNPEAMERIDITDIHHPDESFDVIYCSHVLEHVPDDYKAMQEFCRVLKPGGWALILIPVNVERTMEDSSVIDPEERKKLFGQWDHVRRYGPDVIDRFRKSGFTVEEFHPADFMEPDKIKRYAVTDEPIYFCKKK